MIFMISVVPPKMDELKTSLGRLLIAFGQGDRVGQQDARKSSGIAAGVVADAVMACVAAAASGLLPLAYRRRHPVAA